MLFNFIDLTSVCFQLANAVDVKQYIIDLIIYERESRFILSKYIIF